MKFTILAIVALTTISTALALPIDWHGEFGVDTTKISNYTLSETPSSAAAAAGSERVQADAASSAENASYQGYLLKLKPTVIVNDSASMHLELSVNSDSSVDMGSSSTKDASGGSMANALYFQNSTGGEDLELNRAYMELFADTATFVVGRFGMDWGLGAVFDSGSDQWERVVGVRDGAEGRFKIGSFTITPFWGKLNSNNTKVDTDDVKEFGFSLLYDNVDREMSFGVLYNKRKTKQYSGAYSTSNSSGVSLGGASVKVWDIYLKKSFGRYSFAAEVPFVSGELGYALTSAQVSDYKTNSIIIENGYKLSERWSVGLDFGMVKGDDGNLNKFEAMYLNPNYKIAQLMFAYNYHNFTNANSIYDAYLTNAKYGRFDFLYLGEAWNFHGAFIMALANETAETNMKGFDHEKNTTYTAAESQDDDFGKEIDLGVDYLWSSNVKVGMDFAYWFVGDYYKFDNVAGTTNETAKVYMMKADVSMTF